MLLAGDIGGTKTLLGLFDPRTPRPEPIVVRSFGTLAFHDLPAMIAEFVHDEAVSDHVIDAACFGVAGPVIGEAAELTNVPWRVDARHVAKAFKLSHVQLLNDLQAMAYSVTVLRDSEVHVLQEGTAQREGNMALIAAGTGLGEALLHHMDERLFPSPSEGGHADFPARNEREIALTRYLIGRYGRADIEHVISGRGFLNLFRATHHHACEAGIDPDHPGTGDAPAEISAAALARRCAACVEVLDMFVDAYGAEAGNLALRALATGGVFVGGGIAPKILPALTTGAFMRAFREKPPLDAMLSATPVKVILNPEAGLLGAAVYAAGAGRWKLEIRN
jgi:glucokinase